MEIIDLLRSHGKEIKTCFSVKRIGLFGSFARGEQKESSDIDILVEFEKPTFAISWTSLLIWKIYSAERSIWSPSRGYTLESGRT
jgi:predicted nucleotidyltransferase